MATAFETEVCSRCGGTGQHSFNGEHSRCYKCDGKNGARAYTKRGKAAKEFYLVSTQIRADAVKVGDMIVTDFIGKFRVVSIEKGVMRARYNNENWREIANITLSGAKNSIVVSAETMVRRVPTVEENEKLIAAALAYQETLTKEGLPRKR